MGSTRFHVLRVVLFVCTLSGVACSHNECERSLRAFCRDHTCEAFSQARESALRDPHPPSADVVVRECGEDHIVIQYILPHYIAGRFEYYFATTGELVGVTD